MLSSIRCAELLPEVVCTPTSLIFCKGDDQIFWNSGCEVLAVCMLPSTSYIVAPASTQLNRSTSSMIRSATSAAALATCGVIGAPISKQAPSTA